MAGLPDFEGDGSAISLGTQSAAFGQCGPHILQTTIGGQTSGSGGYGAINAPGLQLRSSPLGSGAHQQSVPPMNDDEDFSHKLVVETFLLENDQVDERVADRFRALTKDQQNQIIEKGSMCGVRDQNAVLVDRIKKAVQGTLRRPQVQKDPTLSVLAKMGDWMCPKCNDLQFGRNETCRKCGIARPADEKASPEVEAFLDKYNIQEHCRRTFRQLTSDQQALVMDRGGMDMARDPTAVLCARVKQAINGTLTPRPSPGGKQVTEASEGDWFCPKCGDLQFKRNDSCRKCGEPNPNMLARKTQSQETLTGMNAGAGFNLAQAVNMNQVSQMHQIQLLMMTQNPQLQQFLQAQAMAQQAAISLQQNPQIGQILAQAQAHAQAQQAAAGMQQNPQIQAQQAAVTMHQNSHMQQILAAQAQAQAQQATASLQHDPQLQQIMAQAQAQAQAQQVPVGSLPVLTDVADQAQAQ